MGNGYSFLIDFEVPESMVVCKSERIAPMAKVPPYNTNSEEYPPSHRNVYHVHDDCPCGKKIKPQHREDGTGGKARCKECIKLG